MIESTAVYNVHPGHGAGVSWGAILAGALGAAALSLILLLLGAGFGFSAISPWTNEGASAKALGISAIVWLTLTQVAAAGLGGYLAGRLRARWATVHQDEVYFRDTAHGFLAWSVATLLSACLVLGSVGGLLGAGAKVGASVASGAATAAAGVAAGAGMVAADQKDWMSYYTDSLFRSAASPIDGLTPATDKAPAGIEAGRIFTNSIAQGQLSQEDKQYLGQVVALNTNLTPAQAETRVQETYDRSVQALQQAEAKARTAADTAKKAAAWTSLWMFIALLCGAFFASLAATFGGRQRDLVVYNRDLN